MCDNHESMNLALIFIRVIVFITGVQKSSYTSQDCLETLAEMVCSFEKVLLH